VVECYPKSVQFFSVSPNASGEEGILSIRSWWLGGTSQKRA